MADEKATSRGPIQSWIYDHAPQRLRDRMDDSAAVKRISASIMEGAREGHRVEPATREDRASEIVRKYSDAVRSGQPEVMPAITKPMQLESYRQEQAFHQKHHGQEPLTGHVPQQQMDLGLSR